MKQYKVTSADINQNNEDDCVLSPDDPIHELKVLSGLGGLGGRERLAELRTQKINQGSNISVTGMEKAELMRKNDIRPGTPEWFQLWFSKPYLTHEPPVGIRGRKR
jgi:hypothetical protein